MENDNNDNNNNNDTSVSSGSFNFHSPLEKLQLLKVSRRDKKIAGSRQTDTYKYLRNKSTVSNINKIKSKTKTKKIELNVEYKCRQ